MLEFSNNEVIGIVLDYINKHQEECKTNNETYFVSKEKVRDLLKKYHEKRIWYEFEPSLLPSKEKLEERAEKIVEECYGKLVSNKTYTVTAEGIEIVKPLKKAIMENKHNIRVEVLKGNAPGIIVGAVLIGILGTMVVVPCVIIDKRYKAQARYSNAKVVTDSGQYDLSDIYVVYNVDNTYFCTKMLEKITEADSVNGNFNLGTGRVGEYYYRDDIYSYYEIETGNKICEDHEDGFYVEKLTDFYDVDDMKQRDYIISMSEVENEINNEYLLSRAPKIKRK